MIRTASIALLLATHALLAGCAVDPSDVGSVTDDALTGTPGAAVDQGTAAQRAAFNGTIYDAYRAADDSLIRPVSPAEFEGRCKRTPAAGSHFQFDVSLDSLDRSRALDKKPLEALRAAIHGVTGGWPALVILQEPPDSAGHATLKFFTLATYCEGAPTLVCRGVGAADGPTREQCGL